MTTADWKTAGQFADAGGHQLFFRHNRKAGGPYLLLLHGFPTASWDWHKMWPTLSQHFQLLAPDLLGFGFSDKPWPHAYQITEQADLVEALLRQHNVRQYHVLAHDYGNSVAQELMARQQKLQEGPLLRSVCFLNGGLFPEAHQPRRIQQWLAGPIGGFLTPFLTQGTLARNFRRIFGPKTPPTSEEIRAFWSLIKAKKGRRCIPGLLAYMAERRAQRQRWVPPLLEGIIPVRLINGPEDPISGKNLVDHFRALLPQADVVTLDGIGHYPQMEAPQATLQAFLAFHSQIHQEE